MHLECHKNNILFRLLCRKNTTYSKMIDWKQNVFQQDDTNSSRKTILKPEKWPLHSQILNSVSFF